MFNSCEKIINFYLLSHINAFRNCGRNFFHASVPFLLLNNLEKDQVICVENHYLSFGSIFILVFLVVVSRPHLVK